MTSKAVVAALVLSMFAVWSDSSMTGGPREALASSAPTTLGKKFSVIFPPNLDPEVMRIYVSSGRAGTGTWRVGSGATTSFSFSADTAVTITIPSGTQLGEAFLATGTISGKRVEVTTSVDASVYADSNATYTSDATSVIPDANLGTRYRILSPKYGTRPGRINVVAIEAGTSVTITPKTTVDGKAAGTPFSVSLAAGDTYTLATASGQDISGSIVESNKPVAIFASHDCTSGSPEFPFIARNQTGACDVLFEQIPPVQSWGRQFILNPFADRKQGGTPVRVVADQDNTVVQVDGSTVATLQAGQVYERNYWEAATGQSSAVNTGMFLTSSKPVLVSVYMRGGGSFLGETGDPALAFIPPFEQFLTKYTVVSAPGNAAQLMNLMAPTAATSSVRFDGRALVSSDFENTWSAVAGTSYSVAQIKSTEGSHTLSASQAFGLVVYGANSFNSYAYVGGMSLSSIGLVDSVTLTTQAGYAGSVGQELCVSANVMDSNGAGLVGVRVDGSITGANAGTALVGTSDASGVARLCYTASNAGSDTVTLTSNQLTASTNVTWTVVAPAVLYNPAAVSVVAGSAMPSLAPTNTGSPVTTWSAAPSLPNGITLNATTGVISGTPSASSAAANYVITASNSAGSTTATVNIEVTAAPVAPSISYSPSSLNLTLNSAMSPLNPTATGTFPVWSVSPALPPGLSFNTQNGRITGTPTEESSSSNFVVTATNSGGSVTATIAIAVGVTMPDISYAQSSVSYVVGSAIASLLPTNAGSPANSWAVSPALPAGLSFNSNTGQISGTPTSAVAAANHTVTATNSAGNDTFVISITVAASLSAPVIAYSPTSLSLTQGNAITAVLPSNSGGPVSSWSVTPALPAGLVFTTSSGRISGTPTNASSSATYSVTATNTAGSSVAQVTIEVAASGGTSTTLASNNNNATTTTAPAATSTTAPALTTTTTTTSTTSTTAATTTTTLPATTTTLRLAAGATTTTSTVPAVSSSGVSLRPGQIAALGITTVISASKRAAQFAVSATPSTCVVAAGKVYSLAQGKCTVRIRSAESGLVTKNWSRQVVAGPERDGNLVALDPIYFLKRQSRPISGIRGAAASASGASEVLIVGHTAILTGLNIWNERLSWDRANNVKSLLRKAGVRAKITTIGLSGTAPLTLMMTERAQAANRRVMIYVIP